MKLLGEITKHVLYFLKIQLLSLLSQSPTFFNSLTYLFSLSYITLTGYSPVYSVTVPISSNREKALRYKMSRCLKVMLDAGADLSLQSRKNFISNTIFYLGILFYSLVGDIMIEEEHTLSLSRKPLSIW